MYAFQIYNFKKEWQNQFCSGQYFAVRGREFYIMTTKLLWIIVLKPKIIINLKPKNINRLT